MLIKLSVILFLVQFCATNGEKLDWDLAIVVDNEIQLLSPNGSVLDSRKLFSSLKAIAYDGIRDQFIVSDRDSKNDTIFIVRLSKETATEPIIKGPPGDVQGLAIDPFDDVLYWTNAINHTINYVKLSDQIHSSKEFIAYDDVSPHAIAIDACNRYLYYTTNPSGHKPTIERRKLSNSSHHEILVDDTLSSPVGLAIDYKDQRLYWADSRYESTAGRIESIALDGSDRRLVVEKTTSHPYGLAVDEEAIYWTDTNNYVLYKFPKSETNPFADPEKVMPFAHKPMGMVSNFFKKDDCKNLTEVVRKYQENKLESLKVTTSIPLQVDCLNGGVLKQNYRCACPRGFTGDYCEISLCSQDYCLSGDCYLPSSGKPMCKCHNGFVGDRCQKDVNDICDSYCLNEGECILTSPRNVPKCSCQEGYIGSRCEYNEEVCQLYCNGKDNRRYSEEFELMCRCNNIFTLRNTSSALQSSLKGPSDIVSKFQYTVVYLSAIILFCLLIIAALFVYIHVMRKRRPRIKKRIVVNKNVTPLTYRPQMNTEQCEITIENCCNMNICETPCFEPNRDDKKKLLTNMEGEDIY